MRFGKLSKIPDRRDGRVVEGARLESVYRGNSIEGSNPSLSAIIKSIIRKHLDRIPKRGKSAINVRPNASPDSRYFIRHDRKDDRVIPDSNPKVAFVIGRRGL